jgi:predicted RNase H-like nuclease (RuvC/YqgF family)
MALSELLTEVERLLPIAKELSTAEDRLVAVLAEIESAAQRATLADQEVRQAEATSRRKIRELDEHHETRIKGLNTLYGDKRHELQTDFDAFRIPIEGTQKRLQKQVEAKEKELASLTERTEAAVREFNEIQSKLSTARKAYQAALNGEPR